MLPILYKQQEKLSISNRDPLVRKNGVMLPLSWIIQVSST